MKRLLIVWHSHGGSTARLAEAVLRGARSLETIEVIERRCFDATLEDLLGAAGVIFGTAEHFGYMSGALKDFFERCFYGAEDKVDHVPYALFVKAKNDGTGTVRSVERIAQGLRLRKVAEAVVVVGEVSEAQLDACEELGATLAAGLDLGIF